MRRNNSCYIPCYYTSHAQSKYLTTQSKKFPLSTLRYELKEEHSPEYKIKEAKKLYNFKLALLEEKKKIERKKTNQKVLKQLNILFDKLEAFDAKDMELTGKTFQEYLSELNKINDNNTNFFPTSIKYKGDQKDCDSPLIFNTPQSVNHNPFEHHYSIELNKQNYYDPSKTKAYKSFYFIQGTNKNRVRNKSFLPKVNYFEFHPIFEEDKNIEKKRLIRKDFKMRELMNQRDNFDNPIFVKDKFSH